MLYISPSFVSTTIQTQVRVVYWECTKTMSQQSEHVKLPKTDDLSKKKDQQNFGDKTRCIGQVIVGIKKNPVCIPRNSVITMPRHTNKILSKVICLVEQAEHHNLPQGIIVNRYVAITKTRSMPIILINTTKQNIWLWQPLLATKLYTVEYHQVEHRANMERKEDNVDISFLTVVPDTIRVQSEQVEATSTDISPPDSIEKPIFGPRPNTKAADFNFVAEKQCL